MGPRPRPPAKALITVMGTAEDIGSREYNGGEVVDTLRKYTDEQKEYMPELIYS